MSSYWEQDCFTCKLFNFTSIPRTSAVNKTELQLLVAVQLPCVCVRACVGVVVECARTASAGLDQPPVTTIKLQSPYVGLSCTRHDTETLQLQCSQAVILSLSIVLFLSIISLSLFFSLYQRLISITPLEITIARVIDGQVDQFDCILCYPTNSRSRPQAQIVKTGFRL